MMSILYFILSALAMFITIEFAPDLYFFFAERNRIKNRAAFLLQHASECEQNNNAKFYIHEFDEYMLQREHLLSRKAINALNLQRNAIVIAKGL